MSRLLVKGGISPYASSFSKEDMRKAEELILPDVIKDNLTCFGRFNKRTIDIIGSTICLIIFSPLFLFCYLK